MSVFWHDVRHIIKSSRVELTWISVLIAFLLSVLNVFAWVGLGAKEFSDTLNDKLGMYFYIVDDAERKDEIYGKVIQLQNTLQSAWLETRFKDKDKALSILLGDKNQDLIEKFDEYGIGNPLPATLNVIFDSEEELVILKKTLFWYRDIITNIKDISNPTTFKEQEQRNLTAINLWYVIMWSSVAIVIVIFIGIITFLFYMLKSKFTNFHKTVQIKKLLGAHYSQITWPFVTTTSILLVVGFVLMLALSAWAAMVLHHYLSTLLHINLLDMLSSHRIIISSFLALELAFLLVVWWVMAQFYTRRLIKKVAH